MRAYTVYTYAVTVKHDNGKTVIYTNARNKTAAIETIMRTEGCPRRAIVSVKRDN